ncbi:hypothetical protein [Sorangium sp. So ce1182]|uniref:hypothetical protein n=1 Tax=Sorangium sp. So ce1182 TaxID=3133334 RepID=UPI003F5EBC45
MPLKNRWFGLALALAGALGLTGCAAEDPLEAEAIGVDSSEIEAIGVARDHVAGDVYHYSFTLRVGHTPNARVRLHRVVREVAPWWPRPAAPAVMLLHGDFATFTTNFAPGTTGATAPPHGGLAVYLAAHGVDVWGFDRRWTLAPADGADLSDFAAMSYAQELDDIERALTFARGTRAATGSGHGKLVLGGFSRGGHLAYVYAGRESQRAPGKRHVRGLVPIDIYARIAPEDEVFRQNACASSAWDQAALQQGVVDSDNGFQITVGSLAASDPGGASPYYPEFTNRDVMLAFIAQTYLFFQPTPVYHLGGGALVDGFPTALRWSAEPVIDSWLAGAPARPSIRRSRRRRTPTRSGAATPPSPWPITWRTSRCRSSTSAPPAASAITASTPPRSSPPRTSPPMSSGASRPRARTRTSGTATSSTPRTPSTRPGRRSPGGSSATEAPRGQARLRGAAPSFPRRGEGAPSSLSPP